VDELILVNDHLPGVTVITVDGELDMMTVSGMEVFIRRVRRPGDQVILDLTKTMFIDCSGVSALLRAHQETRRDGGILRLAAPRRPGPTKVLTITNVDACMPLHASLEQALSAALASPPSAP
jgi:anti-sigma B factor antagonist